MIELVEKPLIAVTADDLPFTLHQTQEWVF
jgi:hypothetical protein